MENLTFELKKDLIKLAKKFNLKLFILFGSRAKNTYNKNSDWDFAYLSSKKINLDLLEEDLFKILDNPNFDLINLNDDILPELEWEIFNKGILIYEDEKNLFIEFKLNSYFTKIDAKQLLYGTRDKFIESI